MNIFNELFIMILNGIDKLVGNYGIAVVLFTIVVRVLLLPLDIKSKKSMRAMSKIQPMMQELQNKYKDDPEKLNKKTAELYKKEHVSPMSGCLPMLIQLPLLFIMFGAMRQVANERTVSMIMDMANQVASGIDPAQVQVKLESFLWIKNIFQPDAFATILPAFKDPLSMITAVANSNILTAENLEAARAFLASDAYAVIAANFGAGQFVAYPIPVLITTIYLTIPSSIHALLTCTNGYFILPAVAGLSQWLMTKLTGAPQPAQGQQANSMGFMNWMFPLMSVWFCLTYTSAFSLYWVVSNLIAMVQQVAVNKILDAQDKKSEAQA